jgi:hypothetical protein
MTRCLAAPPGEQLGVFQLFVGERVIGLRSQSSHKRVAGLPIASEPSRHSGEIISWPESIRCLASRVVMEIYRVGPHLVAQIRSTGQGHHQHARSTTSGSCSGPLSPLSRVCIISGQKHHDSISFQRRRKIASRDKRPCGPAADAPGRSCPRRRRLVRHANGRRPAGQLMAGTTENVVFTTFNA